MKTFLVILSSFFLSILTQAIYAQDKYAILVGISKYGEDTGWRPIHGTNDIDLIKTFLKGYKIRELRNNKATYKNIIQQLDLLHKECKSGDIVYIHFSGHGQPFEDKDGDETDGWDESFIPYDAHLYYEEGIYTGENHLTDDILNKYLQKLRKKMGKTGLLYVVIDACHAGNSYRDTDGEIYRGTGKGFSKGNLVYKVPKEQKIYYKLSNESTLSPIIMLEACQASQINTEILINGKYYGPLSYSIYATLHNKELSKNVKWVKEVQSSMQSFLPRGSRQKMVIESSINL